MPLPRPPVPTLGELAAAEWYWLMCTRCQHAKPVVIADAIQWFGKDVSSDILRRRCRCTRCGSLGASLKARSWSIHRTGASGPEELAQPPLVFRRLSGARRVDWELRRTCNLYSLTKAPKALADLFRVPRNRITAFDPLTAIFPGHTAPVVRCTSDGSREVVPMSWGFVLPVKDRAPRRVTNTRDDKVWDSTFWRSSFEQRRCLVPATSFAEPHDGRTPATWHWFALQGNDARPLFAFAGIWRTWKGPIKKDGPEVVLDTYSFMTTEPNALTRTINHERSPVILTTSEDWDSWLTSSPDEAFRVVTPIDASRLRIVQEGSSKRDEMGIGP